MCGKICSQVYCRYMERLFDLLVTFNSVSESNIDAHKTCELEITFSKVRMVNKCPHIFPENSAAFFFFVKFIEYLLRILLYRFSLIYFLRHIHTYPDTSTSSYMKTRLCCQDGLENHKYKQSDV